jgi:hypothetical protein
MMSLDPNILVDELLKESRLLRSLANSRHGDENAFSMYMGGAIIFTSLASALNKTILAQIKASKEEVSEEEDARA